MAHIRSVVIILIAISLFKCQAQVSLGVIGGINQNFPKRGSMLRRANENVVDHISCHSGITLTKYLPKGMSVLARPLYMVQSSSWNQVGEGYNINHRTVEKSLQNQLLFGLERQVSRIRLGINGGFFHNYLLTRITSGFTPNIFDQEYTVRPDGSIEESISLIAYRKNEFEDEVNRNSRGFIVGIFTKFPIFRSLIASIEAQSNNAISLSDRPIFAPRTNLHISIGVNKIL